MSHLVVSPLSLIVFREGWFVLTAGRLSPDDAEVKVSRVGPLRLM